ncbi:hypothetical protein R50072_23270 [Simiduia litorea]|uniref:hypothetical protein n=1 Tax=Simiduia litorea TaxID=1435348 RepID=UPI0036F25616
MGYILSIKRESDITEAEWLKAVEACDTTKIDPDPILMRNPKTGQTLSMAGSTTDVAVKFTSGGFLGMGVKVTWQKSFKFSDGQGLFRYTENLEDLRNPVRISAKNLAKFLGAKIVGESDEVYSW